MPQTEIVRESWLIGAEAVEGYREQWRVVPEHVGKEKNLRGAQALAWDHVQLQLDPGPARLDWLQWAQPAPDRGLGIGAEL